MDFSLPYTMDSDGQYQNRELLSPQHYGILKKSWIRYVRGERKEAGMRSYLPSIRNSKSKTPSFFCSCSLRPRNFLPSSIYSCCSDVFCCFPLFSAVIFSPLGDLIPKRAILNHDRHSSLSWIQLWLSPYVPNLLLRWSHWELSQFPILYLDRHRRSVPLT